VNVTVVVPNSLRPACEGRKKLELGVPSTADLGDVLHTLFTLYPKLVSHMPSEKRPIRQHLNIFLSEAMSRDVANKDPLREGQTLYLFASQSQPPPLAGRGR
jgi:hypothetical protein